MPKESYDQRKIINFLVSRGAYVVNIRPDGFTRSGTPDLICCYRGLFIAFECKNRRYKNAYKKLESEQQVHALMIRQAHGQIFAVSCVEQVQEVLAVVDTLIADVQGRT